VFDFFLVSPVKMAGSGMAADLLDFPGRSVAFVPSVIPPLPSGGGGGKNGDVIHELSLLRVGVSAHPQVRSNRR
jgi:hypothetical protein